MIAHYFILALFAISGCIAFLAGILNWNWFFNAQNSQFIVRRLGRGWARLVYGVLGAVLVGLAIFFFQTVLQALYVFRYSKGDDHSLNDRPLYM